jgi:serine/threonine protein kinase
LIQIYLPEKPQSTTAHKSFFVFNNSTRISTVISKTTSAKSPIMPNQLAHAAKAFVKYALGCGIAKSQMTSPQMTVVTPQYVYLDDPSGGTATLRKPLPLNRFRRLLKIFGHAKRQPFNAAGQKTPNIENKTTVTNADEDEYEDDGVPTDDKHDRRDFIAIRAITRKTLQNFVLDLLYTGEEACPRTCRVQTRKEGSFHHVVILRIDFSDHTNQEYVLKIPAHGTPEFWQKGDAYMLRSEAILLQHIRHHTQCPVPEVVAFDETLDNPIGVPYILMKKLPGMSAYDMWQERIYVSPTSGDAHLNADEPSLDLEKKRITFLESLATAMALLQKLKFEKIGTPVFKRPDDDQPTSFGPVWRWHSTAQMHELTPIQPYYTSALFYEDGLSRVWTRAGLAHLEPRSDFFYMAKGARKIMHMLLTSPPFARTPQPPPAETDDMNDAQPVPRKLETYVLRHDDLDLQNILIDDDGNVTGIIDWDGCMSVPRCIGPTSLPMFLRRDWLDDHTINHFPHMTWSLDRYRNIYSTAMHEACNGGDAKYTKKSAIYQGLLAVLYEDADCREFLGKLLAEIPEFRRVDPNELYLRLGKGWPAAEKVLKGKVAGVLVPEE